MPSQILILTGMHRSGTSLLASVLQGAGVHIGSELLPGDSRNKRGFFEDVDFYRFHEEALAHRGCTPYVGSEFQFEATPEEREQAVALVRARDGQPLWGWKDPRTCLFLPFWRELLPDARFLFVYRHPLDVLGSLVRRGEAHTPGLLEGLIAWETYQARVVADRREHPESSLLCQTYAAVQRPEELGRLLDQRLGIRVSLSRALMDAHYHPAELQQLPAGAVGHELLRELRPGSAALYDELEALADLPAADVPEKADAQGQIRALRSALSSLPGPSSSSQQRAFLVLLLAVLEEGLIDGYFRHLAQYARQLEMEIGQKSSWLAVVEADSRSKDDVVKQKDESIRQQEVHIAAQKGWIEVLEADNSAKNHHIETQDGEVARLWTQIRVLRERADRLDAIEQSLPWRLARRLLRLLPGSLRPRLRPGEP